MAAAAARRLRDQLQVPSRRHQEHRRAAGAARSPPGLFLKEFVGDIPWVHLDIAGPAFDEGQPHGYTPKGGTGSAVRTLVKLAEEAADGAL